MKQEMQQELMQLTKNTEMAQQYFERKLAFTVGPVELNKIMNENYIQIIDVRNQESYQKAHIKGAMNIPAENLQNMMSELSKDNINVVYCYNEQCHLAAKCALVLAKCNYPVVELEGGFNTWYDNDFEVVSS